MKIEQKSMLSKVPEVTLYFWIIKILCTTVGETASDFLNVSLGLGLSGTSVIMGGLLLIALFFQFRAKKYIPSIYWLTVAGVVKGVVAFSKPPLRLPDDRDSIFSG